MWKRVAEIIRSGYADEEQRKFVMFNLLNLLFAVIAATMTCINWHTQEHELMVVTAVFCALCLLNCLFSIKKPQKVHIAVTLFTIEAMALLVYFVLGGVPEGFSVLWTLLVPAVSLYVFGQKTGVRFSVLVFLMVIFFFWCPFGKSLLYYQYSEVFMLRFPFVYICMFLAALYIDIIRLGVYRKLKDTETHARYLYRHDALTGIYSRHAFYEELEAMFHTPSSQTISMVMFDIDNFKEFNDAFGHNAGDAILMEVARIIRENTCEHCISCRWGGEEFLVLMQCQHDPYEIAEKVRKTVELTVIPYEGMFLHITLSAGVSVTSSLDKFQLTAFINSADQAMYESKLAGKNQTTLRTFPSNEPNQQKEGS